MARRRRCRPPVKKSGANAGRPFDWCAIRPRAILDSGLGHWREKNEVLHASLQKLECVSLAVSTGEDGLLAKALGYVAGPDKAGKVYDYLQARKSAPVGQGGLECVRCDESDLVGTEDERSYVQGSFRITSKALDELWTTKLVVKAKRGAPPEATAEADDEKSDADDDDSDDDDDN